MLTLEDCLGLCELTEQEVLAIAQHEHVPEMAALELGNYLVHAPGGEMRIKAIIRDDIAEARSRGDCSAELTFKLVLREFVLQHPQCDERCRARVRLPERRLEGDQALQPRPA
ncbi:MAG TPA: hypothetical protein VGP97_19630 [Burkholderiales bacterium]|jgi:hypothetical protein|nr:hypothetical protein [Burkholderiales bacterium]